MENLQLSLRPQQSSEEADNSLPSLLGRIHAQRGPEAFREFTEESLQAEIDGKDKEELPDAEAAKPDDDFDISEEVKMKRAKMEEGRIAILTCIGSAIQETQSSLDYISLILTQYQPELAAASLSQGVKGQIPLQCLSLDRVAYEPSQNELSQHRVLSRTWKTEALNTSADLLRNAGQRIGREALKEKKFWGEVMGIKERGWTIVQRRGGVAVKYGFTEASPEFKNKGVGPLKRGEDGSIIVEEVNLFAGKEKHLRVRYLVGGAVKGSAIRQYTTDASSAVESEILKARDHLFETEIFFELMREARTLASHDIHTADDSITIQICRDKAIKIDLISESEMQEMEKPASTPGQLFTEGICHALHILLCYNHNRVLERRSAAPVPLGLPKPSLYPLFILRSLTTYLHHNERTENLSNYISKITSLCRSAGLISNYTLSTKPPTLRNPPTNTTSTSIVNQFNNPFETNVTLTLPGPYVFTITMSTQITPPLHGSIYKVTPSSSPSGLISIAPSALSVSTYTTFEDLQVYLRWLLEMSVLQEILNKNPLRETEGGLRAGWEQIGSSNEAVYMKGRRTEATVKVVVEEDDVLLVRGEKRIFGRWDGEVGQPTMWEVVERLQVPGKPVV
ncbi:hypothetical protein BJ508DRAFT_237536 [Ascobolus immersus RN42]|uniref:Mediator of RNA polymerase II transcription subunit 17 n=1 Tax=Ascobolus immersus RN42 TaxID=1160509 RepID=A0A3N4ICB6_ASCIM|nr:hypothetical protein BJ508DRAFT_237536 [Ascobolus immersus RN42]